MSPPNSKWKEEMGAFLTALVRSWNTYPQIKSFAKMAGFKVSFFRPLRNAAFIDQVASLNVAVVISALETAGEVCEVDINEVASLFTDMVKQDFGSEAKQEVLFHNLYNYSIYKPSNDSNSAATHFLRCVFGEDWRPGSKANETEQVSEICSARYSLLAEDLEHLLRQVRG
jgi:hypothetical protein